jgi:chromosome segregation ATPase
MTQSTALQTDLQKNTQTAFLFLNVITGACHSIVNQSFIAPTPKPDWFDTLNGELDDSKTVANTWINDLAEDVIKQIPLSIINYDTTYTAFTQKIHDIANAHPEAQGSDNQYVKQVQGLIDEMLNSDGAVNSIIQTMEDTDTKLKEWGKKIQTAHDNLQNGAVNIQQAETDLQTDIDKMNNDIQNLHDSIDTENKVIAGAAIGIGVGLLIMVVGIALIPETGGASAYIAAGSGALMVVGGAATWGVMQHKINEQFDQINEDTKQLNDDKRQLISLQSLAAAANTVVNNLATTSQALSELRTFWGTFKGELEGVQTKLNNAEKSLNIIVQDTFTDAAMNEWRMAVDTATQLSEMTITFDAQTLPATNVPA